MTRETKSDVTPKSRDKACGGNQRQFHHVVFDGPPSPEAGRFVEVEDDTGRSYCAGEWRERRDGLWELLIPICRCASQPANAVAAVERLRDEWQGLWKKWHSGDRAQKFYNYTVAATSILDAISALPSASEPQEPPVWNYDMDAAPKHKTVWVAVDFGNGDVQVGKAYWATIQSASGCASGWYARGYKVHRPIDPEPFAWRLIEPAPSAPPTREPSR